MSGKHPRRRKRRKGRKPVTQSVAASPPPAPLNFSAPNLTTIRDRFQLLKQRTTTNG